MMAHSKTRRKCVLEECSLMPVPIILFSLTLSLNSSTGKQNMNSNLAAAAIKLVHLKSCCYRNLFQFTVYCPGGKISNIVIVILFNETLRLAFKHRHISGFCFSPGEKPGRGKTQLDIHVHLQARIDLSRM